MNGISIIICTYNGKQKLEETLLAILKLKATFSWELLVVDNASIDGTAAFTSSLLSDSTIDFRILHEAEPGLIKARLCGLRASKYDVLLYCDDDNTLDINYMQIGYDLMKMNPIIGALGGCGTPVFENKKPEWFDKYGHSFAVGPQAINDGLISEYPAELYGAGAFFRKSVLLQFLEKGFKSGLSGRTGNNLVSGEDVEWCYLIQLAGYQIWYDHRLIFTHAMPKGRMNWEYYLRLKQGIASGTGQLLPYSCLFINKNMRESQYLINWFKQTSFATLLYLNYKIRMLFSQKMLASEDKLGEIILKAKMISFYNNAIPAYKHFRKLKAII
ncbi:glycosyltransferase [Flavobacterium myungsuense]|uniref:Glycosyltransferase n=1 Tax=Flavobacterium myungsuense TaxID=651823 RepID=A0ABW3IZG3_9FLAO